jgi:hypothetical protein
MNESMRAYLADIALTDTATQRIQETIREATSLYATTPEQIFVSDHIDNEGVRRYVNFLLCTDKGLIEAKNFMTAKTIDFTRRDFLPIYIETSYVEFDLETPTEKSRISARITLGDRNGASTMINLQLFAAQNN